MSETELIEKLAKVAQQSYADEGGGNLQPEALLVAVKDVLTNIRASMRPIIEYDEWLLRQACEVSGLPWNDGDPDQGAVWDRVFEWARQGRPRDV